MNDFLGSSNPAMSVEEVLALMHSDAPRSEKIGEFVAFTNHRFSDRNLDAVDAVLRQLEVVHPIGVSVAFLRSTFCARELLPAWSRYRDAVKAASDAASDDERNGFTTSRLMVGLLDK